MPYKIKYSGSDKVILERSGTGCTVALFVVVGSIFVITGACLMIFPDNPAPFLSYVRYLFLIMGLLAIYGGINYPKQAKKITPEFITFDNQNGYVKIEQSKDSADVAYIPYSEIKGYDINIEKESSSSSTRSSSRTYYTYHVIIRKKDGSEWELFKRNSKSDAEELITKLKTEVKLDTPIKTIPKAPLTQKLIKEFRGDKTIIRWHNKLGSGPIVFAFFILLLAATFWIILNEATRSDVPFFVYFIAGGIGMLFTVIIIFNVKRIIKDATTVYGISVNKLNFEYFEQDHSENIKASKVIPLKDLHSVSFSFKPSETSSSIYILSKEENKKEEELKNQSFSIKNLRENISLYKDRISLNITALNTIERLQLENWIQELVREKSGVGVL